MKVLVTGGNGQLAQALFATTPASVTAVGLGRDELDVANEDAVDRQIAAERPDLIINCAAYTAVDAAEEDEERAFSVNATGARNIAEGAARTGARLIHISTDFVFDGKASQAYAPDAIPGPIGVYGETKLAGERAVLEACPDATIIRTAWLWSIAGRNFVTTMLRLMHEREEVRVVDDQIGTPTHCRSLAVAIWILAEHRSTGIHHFTDAGTASWFDFAVAIQEEALATGLLESDCTVVPIPTAEFPTPAQRPAFSVLDKRSTWELIGARPRHWRSELRNAFARSTGGADA